MKLASVEKVLEVLPIEGADQIELTKVLGWQVVTKKGEYKPGDLCAYIQIDTVVPRKPEFEFLRSRDFRVRTIKLRKQISQGLIVPLPAQVRWNEGDDLTEVLEIKKFSKEAQETKPKAPKIWYKKYLWFAKQFFYKMLPFLNPKPEKLPFPSNLIPKTDEERIQNIPKVLDRYNGKAFVISEKLDGSSITIIHGNNGRYRICSRNWEMAKGDDDWTRVFNETNFKVYLEALIYHYQTKNIMVQGEYIGKPQKNPYKLAKDEIRLFNIYVDGKRISQKEFNIVTQQYNIPHCPILAIMPLDFNMQEILLYAEGKSKLNRETEREGLVFRDVQNTISFKVISNKFLLKNNE
jgi:hypothetical protein